MPMPNNNHIHDLEWNHYHDNKLAKLGRKILFRYKLRGCYMKGLLADRGFYAGICMPIDGGVARNFAAKVTRGLTFLLT